MAAPVLVFTIVFAPVRDKDEPLGLAIRIQLKFTTAHVAVTLFNTVVVAGILFGIEIAAVLQQAEIVEFEIVVSVA
jgi:hypothetical protein